MRCQPASARRRGVLLSAVVALASWGAPAAHAGSQRDTLSPDALEAGASAISGWAVITAQLDTAHSVELLEAIHAGLRSRVVFEARLYRERTGISRVIGDQLIAELQVTHIGSFDPLASTYVLDRSRQARGGEQPASQPAPVAAYLDRQMFTEHLLGIHAELISRLPATSDQLYVALRVRLQPVDFVAPLHLISMFGGGTTAIPWHNLPMDY
jgi:hypothetical protein